MDELKPCPFCGHPRSRLMSKREYCKDVEHNVAIRFAFWRKCNKCGATSGIVKTEPVYWVHYDPEDEWAKPWREQANEAWNRRAGECDRYDLLTLADDLGNMSEELPPAFRDMGASIAHRIRESLGVSDA